MTIEIRSEARQYSSKILTLSLARRPLDRYIHPVRSNARRARRSSIVVAAFVVATLLGPALGAAAAKTTATSTTTTTTKSSTECAADQLSFSSPGAVSAQMGEEAFVITLTNVGTRLCQIHGYPTVRFYTSAGRLLTFSYAHTSLFFPRIAPHVVNLAPGSHGFFIVAKYRCDLGIRYHSSFFYLIAPYTSGPPWVVHTSGYFTGVMDYCKGAPHGMGHDLGISPIVAKRSQLFN
jgi:hypothetical protein